MGSTSSLTRIGTTILLSCLLAGSGGSAYNALSIRHYRQLAGVPGKAVRHRRATRCTLLLGERLANDHVEFRLGRWTLRAGRRCSLALSGQTRVCSYDLRFRLERIAARCQDANAISLQLHQLIEAAAVQRPFVLVGHSISGNLSTVLRSAINPGDLAGLVFVDGATPLQDERIPKEL